jgi:hypothetical protein
MNGAPGLAPGRPRRGAGGPGRESARPVRAQVDLLLSEGVWNTVVRLRELQSRGYAGGVSILRDYVRPKWAGSSDGLGEQRSIIAAQAVSVHFAVSTLGYSRRFHFFLGHRLRGCRAHL